MNQGMRRLFTLFALSLVPLCPLSAEGILSLGSQRLLLETEAGESGAFVSYGNTSMGRLLNSYPYMVNYKPYDDMPDLNSIVSNRIRVFNVETASLLWECFLESYPLRIDLKDHRLYILTESSLYCLNADNGTQIWRFLFSSDNFSAETGFVDKLKLYKSPSRHDKERGAPFPSFDISPDGTECILCHDYKRLALINLEDLSLRWLDTGITKMEQVRSDNFAVFYGKDFLVKMGHQLRAIGRDGAPRYSFTMDSPRMAHYPILLGSEADGIILPINDSLYLLGPNGAVLKKVKYDAGGSLRDCVLYGDRLYVATGNSEFICFTKGLKRLWTFKSPEKLKVGNPLFDAFDLRVWASSGILVYGTKSGEERIFLLCGTTAFLLDGDAKLLDSISVLPAPKAKGLALVKILVPMSMSKPVYKNGEIILVSSEVLGKPEKDSKDFHVKDYVISINVGE